MTRKSDSGLRLLFIGAIALATGVASWGALATQDPDEPDGFDPAISVEGQRDPAAAGHTTDRETIELPDSRADRITGIVSDAITGAGVRATIAFGDHALPTSTSGSFVVDRANGTGQALRITAPLYLPAQVGRSETTERLNVRLSPSGRCTVRVVDHTNSPRAGVSIRMDAGTTGSELTTTDSAGSAAVPVGQPYFAVAVDGDIASDPFVVRPGDHRTVVIRSHDERRTLGLRCPTAEWRDEVRVRIQHLRGTTVEWERVCTGRVGLPLTRLSPGRYRAEAIDGDFRFPADRRTSAHISRKAGPTHAHFEVDATVDGPIWLEVVASAVLRLRLTDAETGTDIDDTQPRFWQQVFGDAPTAGWQDPGGLLQWRRQGSHCLVFSTDLFEELDEPSRLCIRVPGFRDAFLVNPSELSGTDSTVTVRMERGERRSVRFRHPSGAPRKRALVLSERSDDTARSHPVPLRALDDHVIPDADGRVSFFWHGGSVRVHEPTGRRTTSLCTLSADALAARANLEVTLPASGRITVRSAKPSPTLVGITKSGATVRARYEGGAAHFYDLLPDDYTIIPEGVHWPGDLAHRIGAGVTVAVLEGGSSFLEWNPDWDGGGTRSVRVLASGIPLGEVLLAPFYGDATQSVVPERLNPRLTPGDDGSLVFQDLPVEPTAWVAMRRLSNDNLLALNVAPPADRIRVETGEVLLEVEGLEPGNASCRISPVMQDTQVGVGRAVVHMNLPDRLQLGWLPLSGAHIEVKRAGRFARGFAQPRAGQITTITIRAD